MLYIYIVPILIALVVAALLALAAYIVLQKITDEYKCKNITKKVFVISFAFFGFLFVIAKMLVVIQNELQNLFSF